MTKTIFWLRAGKKNHIHTSPAGDVLKETANSFVVKEVGKDKPFTLPKQAVNSKQEHKGNYYFDDFTEMLDFMMASDNV